MKTLATLLIGFALLASGTAQPAAPPAQVSLSGVLRTGIMAEGGETTGTLLKYQNQQGQPATIEVEVTGQTVGAALVKDGAAVTITGAKVVHAYVERGNVPRLVAARITPGAGS